MPTEVLMPQMGESIFEGTITKWLKKPGDTVQRDEPLFEISTDKVDAEIPSPAAGVLTEIRARRKVRPVQVNAVVGVIGDGASAPAAPPAPAKAETPKAQPARPAASRGKPKPLPSAGVCSSGSASGCRRWASPASKAPSRSGSRMSVTPSSATSLCLKSPPTRSMPRFPRQPLACSPRSKSLRARSAQINTVVAVIGGAGGANLRLPQQLLPAPSKPRPLLLLSLSAPAAAAPRKRSMSAPRPLSGKLLARTT